MTSNDQRDFLFELEKLIQSRYNERPEGSYTTRLFEGGVDAIAQKVGEEAVEVVIASKNEDRTEVIYESADLLYHLLVLLTQREIGLDEIVGELQNRHS
ncbi:MAG: phosphoribosyl-ATP diphosphatase [Balneolaceae bacterium]